MPQDIYESIPTLPSNSVISYWHQRNNHDYFIIGVHSSAGPEWQEFLSHLKANKLYNYEEGGFILSLEHWQADFHSDICWLRFR